MEEAVAPAAPAILNTVTLTNEMYVLLSSQRALALRCSRSHRIPHTSISLQISVEYQTWWRKGQQGLSVINSSLFETVMSCSAGKKSAADVTQEGGR